MLDMCGSVTFVPGSVLSDAFSSSNLAQSPPETKDATEQKSEEDEDDEAQAQTAPSSTQRGLSEQQKQFWSLTWKLWSQKGEFKATEWFKHCYLQVSKGKIKNVDRLKTLPAETLTSLTNLAQYLPSTGVTARNFIRYKNRAIVKNPVLDTRSNKSKDSAKVKGQKRKAKDKDSNHEEEQERDKDLEHEEETEKNKKKSKTK